MAKGLVTLQQRAILKDAIGNNDEGALERVLDQFCKFCRLDHTEVRGLMSGTHKVVTIQGEGRAPRKTVPKRRGPVTEGDT